MPSTDMLQTILAAVEGLRVEIQGVREAVSGLAGDYRVAASKIEATERELTEHRELNRRQQDQIDQLRLDMQAIKTRVTVIATAIGTGTGIGGALIARLFGG